MKKLIFGFILFITTNTVFAQSTQGFFVDLGGAYTTFQDTKFSDVSYGGIGLAFAFGFQKESPKATWSGGLAINFSKENSNTHNQGAVTVVHPKFYSRYLKKINENLSIGAHWDILGMYYRSIEGLQNNGNYYITSSDLFAAATYQMGKFKFGLDLGLFSFQKESTGFAFSAPQNGLENGDFDYQDEKLDDPFGFNYFVFKPIWQQLNIRTSITYQWKERLSVGYRWSARHFAEVENRPVTIGTHQIVVRYNLTHKTKEAPVTN